MPILDRAVKKLTSFCKRWKILTCASVGLIVLFLTVGCIARNEVLGCMLTHTNTLTKHYYIQSSATLLPPSQRDLYPNAAPLITLHGL